ncbi:MAG: DUF3343 domain-containing protein [Clostridia bacterium]|nr:DUF3343 domain-containing protein [Clostridia bacterium]
MRRHLIVAFGTTTMALMMEHMCRAEGMPGRLIPLPREIDAGCGMAWMAEPEEEEALLQFMTRRQIRYERMTCVTF